MDPNCASIVKHWTEFRAKDPTITLDQLYRVRDIIAERPFCRGSYQSDIIRGSESLSGSTLKGAAARYAGRYRASAKAMFDRLNGIEITLGPEKRFWVEAAERRERSGKRVLVLTVEPHGCARLPVRQHEEPNGALLQEIALHGLWWQRYIAAGQPGPWSPLDHWTLEPDKLLTGERWIQTPTLRRRTQKEIELEDGRIYTHSAQNGWICIRGLIP